MLLRLTCILTQHEKPLWMILAYPFIFILINLSVRVISHIFSSCPMQLITCSFETPHLMSPIWPSTFSYISAWYLHHTTITLQGTVGDSSAELTWGLVWCEVLKWRCCTMSCNLPLPSISAEEPCSNKNVVIIVHVIPIIPYFTQAKR